MQPSPGSDRGRDPVMSPRERRQLGSAYLHAYVTEDLDELRRLTGTHTAEDLVAALAVLGRALLIHIADVEETRADIVSLAYRNNFADDESDTDETTPPTGTSPAPPV